MQYCIVVACDEFMGAHKDLYLPVFGVFNYVHCTLSLGGGIRLVPQAILVTGNMHHRGMEFGGAHVWKTSHPQTMGFFCTQKLELGESLAPCSHIRCVKTSLSSKHYA